MAKKKSIKKTPLAVSSSSASTGKVTSADDILRQPAEEQYADQLEALKQNDSDPRPANWLLSPRAVVDYIVGGKKLKAKLGGTTSEVEITKKFFGDLGIVQRSVVTLASERALLLVGEPGTGKSWLSEHLAAAISGNSTLTIQGTAGTTEEQIKYSWNIARVIAEGATPENLVPSPTMIGMRQGTLLRFEEITRCVPDVQDSLVSILSDKSISVPELPDANTVRAKSGFNVIATANTRDQGVNELSAALKRRFNYIYIPIVADEKTEVTIVQQRSAELIARYDLPIEIPKPIVQLLAIAFREMRDGKTKEGVSIKKPSTSLSTAEAIGVALDAALHARFFGSGQVTASDIARNMLGSVVKEDQADAKVLKEYAVLIAKRRGSKDKHWQDFHDAMIEQIK
jgi:MoxR-like ATPase